MDTAANAAIGKAMYEVWRSRYALAGRTLSPMRLGSMGEFLAYGENLKVRHPLDDSDPRLAPYQNVLGTMVWAAYHGPGKAHKMAGMVGFLQTELERKGLQLLSPQEATALTKKLIALAKQQQPAGTLGAAGHAIFYNITRCLARWPPGRDNRARRARFLKEAEQLCLRIESSAPMSERKHLSSLLSEQFTKELRCSCPQASMVAWAIDMFASLLRIVATPSIER